MRPGLLFQLCCCLKGGLESWLQRQVLKVSRAVWTLRAVLRTSVGERGTNTFGAIPTS